MNTFSHRIAEFARSESGVVATEYALLLTVIVLTLLGSVTALGQKVDRMFQDIVDQLPA